MQLWHLKLNDFLSHKSTRLEFSDKQQTLIEGPSGNGKSAIVEAIVWVLYAKGRVDSRSLIRHGAEQMSVCIGLKVDGKDYEITRKINRSGKHELSITVDGEPAKVTGLKPSQEYIESKITGASYELFVNSAVYLQDNPDSFVKQSAINRKDLLFQIVKSARFDGALEQTKELLTSKNIDRAVIDSKISATKTRIENNKEAVAKLKDLDKERQVLEKNLLEIHKELVALDDIIERTRSSDALVSRYDIDFRAEQERRNKASEVHDKALEELEKINYLDTDSLKKEIDTLPVLKEELKKVALAEEKNLKWKRSYYEVMALEPNGWNFLDITDEIESLEKEISKIKKEGPTICEGRKTACKTLVARYEEFLSMKEKRLVLCLNKKDEYTNKLKIYTEALNKLGPEPPLISDNLIKIKIKKIEDIKAVWEKSNNKDLKATLEETVSYNKDIVNKANAKLLELDRAYLKHKEDKLEWQKASDKKKKVLIAFYECETAITANKSWILSYRRQLEDTELENHRLKKEQEQELELAKEIEGLKILKEAFSSNGIKAMVIDRTLPELEDRINGILSKLSEFRIKLSTTKPSASGDKEVEGLFILVLNDQGEELDFDNYSGGERLKIIVSISEALAELQKAKFRILDELFIGLDEESTERFGEILLSMQEKFSQLLCISHLKSIKSLFDTKIIVNKKDGISFISKT